MPITVLIFLGFTFKIESRFGHNKTRNWIVDDGKIVSTAVKTWTLSTVVPSAKGIDSVKERLKEIFRSHNGGNCDFMIKKLNAVIRGWANSKKNWGWQAKFYIFMCGD